MTPASITRLPLVTSPKPPRGLARDGRRLWLDLQRTYGITDPAGLLLLETACKSFDDWSAARARLEEEGLLVPDRQGSKKLNPVQRQVKDSHAAMMAALRLLHFDVQPVRAIGRPPGGRRG
jgi:phage terminase small subunit